MFNRKNVRKQRIERFATGFATEFVTGFATGLQLVCDWFAIIPPPKLRGMVALMRLFKNVDYWISGSEDARAKKISACASALLRVDDWCDPLTSTSDAGASEKNTRPQPLSLSTAKPPHPQISKLVNASELVSPGWVFFKQRLTH